MHEQFVIVIHIYYYQDRMLGLILSVEIYDPYRPVEDFIVKRLFKLAVSNKA